MARKGKSLSLAKKLAIVGRLNGGEKPAHLSRLFRVPRTTINDMKRDADKIIRYVAGLERRNGDVELKKTMTSAVHERLDRAVYQWYGQHAALGHQPRGKDIKDKALHFNTTISPSSNFKASDGWLQKFKFRHGIKLKEKRKKLTTDTLIQNEMYYITKKINSVMKKHGLTKEHVYNCDEIGLFWKALPPCQRKVNKNERFTILTCANSTGSHRLPLLVIDDKGNIPGEEDQTSSTSLTQRNTWIDKNKFVTWIEKSFLPSAKGFLRSKRLKEKVVLILDDAPTHPTWSSECSIILLPLSVAPSIQPMNQSIHHQLRQLYRKYVMTSVLDVHLDSKRFLADFRADLAVQTLNRAWQDIPQQCFHESWSGILQSEQETTHDTNHVRDILAMCKQLSDFSNLEEDCIRAWLDVDKEDSGFLFLSDEEIIENTLAKARQDGAEIKEEAGAPDDGGRAAISSCEAQEMLESCLEWFSKEGLAQTKYATQLKEIIHFVRYKQTIKIEQEIDV